MESRVEVFCLKNLLIDALLQNAWRRVAKFRKEFHACGR